MRPVESGELKILSPTKKRTRLCQSASQSQRHKFHFPNRLSKSEDLRLTANTDVIESRLRHEGVLRVFVVKYSEPHHRKSGEEDIEELEDPLVVVRLSGERRRKPKPTVTSHTYQNCGRDATTFL